MVIIYHNIPRLSRYILLINSKLYARVKPNALLRRSLGFLPRYIKGMIPVGTIPPTFRYFYLCIYLFLGYIFTYFWATSFMEKLILPILSLPRQTTVTTSPRVR